MHYKSELIESFEDERILRMIEDFDVSPRREALAKFIITLKIFKLYPSLDIKELGMVWVPAANYLMFRAYKPRNI